MAEPVCSHFNPRTPCGVRPRLLRATEIRFFHFNPRTPCGVRRRIPRPQLAEARFQSTHPLRGATEGRKLLRRNSRNFNPRTPCGVRLRNRKRTANGFQFQSTHPLRGATGYILSHCALPTISIHAPLAGCDIYGLFVDFVTIISIHAPLAGCDRASPPRPSGRKYFNPRTPCGVRRTSPSGVFCMSYFNPRTPCGVRPLPLCRATSTPSFQSTHPLRGATAQRSL